MTKEITLCAMLFIAPFLASCERKTPIAPPISQPVNVDVASGKVSSASDLSIRAGVKVDVAKAELEKARKEAEDAKALVEEMRKAASPYAEQVDAIRSKYVSLINSLTIQLQETKTILQQQLVALREATIDLQKAKQASLASEAEKQALRSSLEAASQNLNQAQQEVKKLQEWKNKNIWYKKFFWWTVVGAVLFAAAYIYLAAPTMGAGLVRRLRR